MSRPAFGIDLTEGSDGLEAPRDEGRASRQGAAIEAAPSFVLITTSPSSVLEAWPRGEIPSVAALVPNMVAYSHDASEQGLVGAAIGRLRRSGPRTMARVGLIGAREPRGILGMDLAVLVKLLIELDMHALRRFKPSQTVLAASITDVALAAGNRTFFESYVRHSRRKLRTEPWLETWNPGHLLRRVREWETEIAGILTPLNPRGYMMRPDLDTCLEEMRRTKVAIWAREVTAGGSVDLREGFAFAESVGARAVVVRPGDLGEIRTAGLQGLERPAPR